MSRTKGRRPQPIIGRRDPRQGYKTSTRTWRVDAPPEDCDNTQTEHWSGQLDATVRPRPLRVKMAMVLPDEEQRRLVVPKLAARMRRQKRGG